MFEKYVGGGWWGWQIAAPVWSSGCELSRDAASAEQSGLIVI
jgi:hypothetical protein